MTTPSLTDLRAAIAITPTWREVAPGVLDLDYALTIGNTHVGTYPTYIAADRAAEQVIRDMVADDAALSLHDRAAVAA